MAHDEVVLTYSDDKAVAFLCLGGADERAIVLTPTRMASLTRALDEVRASQVRGLVISAPSLDSFCVGADITMIQGVTDPAIGAQLAAQGQHAYNQLEDLRCITVAAISGPCVGGGCELVLACKHRIISEHPASAIGLPETKLGILPGFGGTYRLPRVVGLPKALDIILAGKTLKATQASKAGLVDEITSTEKLLARAEKIARGEKPRSTFSLSLRDRFLTFTQPGRSLVYKQAEKSLYQQTKGFYPAPPTALDVTVEGLSRSREEALRVEAQHLGNLIVTKESKALVSLFFLTEAAKGLGRNARKEIEKIHTLVVGAGTMGAGIASVLAKSNHSVIVKDTTDGALQRGKEHVSKELKKLRYLSSFERAAISSRIDWLQFSSPTIARSQIVIEAVFEDMALKKRIFSDLATQVSPQCILASNTSSLSITEMASAVSNPERFIGMHFFNPVEKMPLVEIIRGAATSDETIARVAALTTEMGKFPIVVNDVPGFLINRTLIPYINEALFLLEEGHSIEEIDGAALAFGMPMGPIRLLDEVGIDVAKHVSAVMVAGYGSRMASPAFAEKLLALGRKGRKSGAGFYTYTEKPKGKRRAEASEVVWDGAYDALNITRPAKRALTQTEITERLVYHLVNEAMKCLNEGVAGSDRAVAEKQIDLGTVMGIGFPPFRGGVLYYGRQVGMAIIHEKLKSFEDLFGERYRSFEE